MRSQRLSWLGVIAAFVFALVVWPDSALARPAKAKSKTTTSAKKSKAASGKPRVAVDDFEGEGAKGVRAAVLGQLQKNHFVVVPPKKVNQVADSSGAELDTESGRVRVAKKLKLRAFITGQISPAPRKRVEVLITVYSGSDGSVAAEYKETVAKSSAVKEVKARLWDEIGKALSDAPAEAREPERLQNENENENENGDEDEAITSAPAPVAPKSAPRAQQQPAPTRRPTPAPEKSAEREEEESEEEDEKPARKRADDDEALALEKQTEQEEPSGARPSAFDVSVGALVGTRSFGYNDSLPGLRVYSLGLSPSLAVHGHWYPAAHFQGGALAHIGLDVRADILVGVTSKDKAGQEFSTSSHGFGIGLRGRIPLDALELGAVFGFSQRSFSLANSKTIDPDVPDVTYNSLRIGAEARYQFVRPFAVQVRAAYLVGLGLGEISDKTWFPHASGNGIEAELSLQLSMSRVFGVELALGMQRYFLSLNPEPDDPGVLGTRRVAGGALDKYFSSRLGVIIRP
ncbi:MAG: hypothetical protein RL701_7935 [Pseudomonadota bacterium]|jgi:hypothetical protein